VLLHGFATNSTVTWQTMAPLLANKGYCVFTVDYGIVGPLGGLAKVVPGAFEVRDFIDRVLTSTGAQRVDLVGHSEGATMPFYYLTRLGGAEKVDRLVGIAPLWRGTTQLGLAPLIDALFRSPVGPQLAEICGACRDMIAGSDFLADLDPHGNAAPQVRFTNIMTRYDENATPYTTGVLDGANSTNIVVQDVCATDYSEHYQLPSSPTTAGLVLNALDPSAATPPPCTTVLPFVGTR
jgi:triacylglycerol esterase/lipase EstA (alpha/beta hydrolase family)